MKQPTTLFYFNHTTANGLLHLTDECGLTDPDRSKSPKTPALLGKALLDLFNPVSCFSDGNTSWEQSSADLELLFAKFARMAETPCFTTLEAAFREALTGEAQLVDIEDQFELANPYLAIDHRLFLFHIPESAKQDYVESDRYFQQRTRSWSVTLAASCKFCRGMYSLAKAMNLHERFRACGFREIPLRVMGCFLKFGPRAELLPIAIWL